MTDKLLPCPFCGGEARLDQRVTQSLWNSDDAVFSHVSCDECDVHGQDFCNDPDGSEAAEWWNTRAAPRQPEGETFMGEPVIPPGVEVSRESLQALFRASGCSGAVENSEVVKQGVRAIAELREECEHLKACQENAMLHMTGLVAERDTLRQQRDKLAGALVAASKAASAAEVSLIVDAALAEVNK